MNTSIIDNLGLKPIFTFKLNSLEHYFGIFVGRKENYNTFPTGLDWVAAEPFPLDKLSATSVWLIPLLKLDDGTYATTYNSSPSFTDRLSNSKIDFCHLFIAEQPKNVTKWSQYTKLESVKNAFELKFEAKEFSISQKSIPFTIIEKENTENKINGYFFGTDTIESVDTLLKFDGIECDIVNEIGKKSNFHIWCGLRKSEKVLLSINNSGNKDNNIGTDCPFVWCQTGLKDDTIFPSNDTDSFTITTKKLCLDNNGIKDYMSESFSYIDIHNKIQYNKLYSWFIKEGGNNGTGRKIYPFFKYVKDNQIDTKGTLNEFILYGLKTEIPLQYYNLIYCFQVNRFEKNQSRKSILSWVVGGLNIDSVNKFIKEFAIARQKIDRASPQSLSIQFDTKKLKFNGSQQMITEHTIVNNRISFVGSAIFLKPPKTVKKIEKLVVKSTDTYSINLTNIRKQDFDRLERNVPEITIDNLEYKTDDIGRTTDSGTFFGFKILTKKDLLSNIKGTLDDGTFAFDLEETGEIEANIYLSFQLQKAQKPMYIWEYYYNLEKDKKDTIVPCYAIEDFRIPIKSITPLSTDLSYQDGTIADNDNISLSSTGTLRPEQPLIIPLSKEDEQKYSLSFSENINVGQDFFFAAELLLRDPKQKDKKNEISVVVIGNEPQTAVRVQTPFGTSSNDDSNKWIVARKNSLSADSNVWEILNENDKGIRITFPPQVMGEAFRKTEGEHPLPGEPTDNGLVPFKFGPPATIEILNEQLNRQMVAAPWNLRSLFGTYGDSNPGLRLLKAQFELLYGMSANFENKDAFIAEMDNKLGQMVKAPRGRILWEHSTDQSEAFKQAYDHFFQILKLYISRLAIYEVSATANKFQPSKFDTGINYFFRIGENKIETDKITSGSGAKLFFPFNDTPSYLQKIRDKYHQNDAVDGNGQKAVGLAGGFHWGFESKAIYYELMTQGLLKGSSSGEIENLALSSLGGYGKQVARFANDKTIIKSTTTMGRTHFYAVERMGRIGVLWNKAKHVIEYERTVVPSKQFKGTQNEGRVIVRKVREFIEILEPERKYPEFGAEQFSSGCVKGTSFKSIKIPVNSTWGRDLIATKNKDEEPYGWEVPLWNKNADFSVYPFPQIMLNLMATKDSGLSKVLCNIVNPENIYFYTDVRDRVAGNEITAETNDWPSVAEVDYTIQPFQNIYLGAPPCLEYNDPQLVNTPLPSPIEVLPGFERFTFKVLPSDIPISANGAYNDNSTISAKLRTVTLQRKPIQWSDQDIYNHICEKEKNFTKAGNKILVDNLNGYSGLLKTVQQVNNEEAIDRCKVVLERKEVFRKNIQDHLGSFFRKIDSEQSDSETIVDRIITQAKAEPLLNYLKKSSTTNGKAYNEFYNGGPKEVGVIAIWELPTLVLWNQLVAMLEAAIGTVDKHYKITFDLLKSDLFEMLDNVDIANAQNVIIDEINSFKDRIDSAKNFVELHLGFLDQFFDDEIKRFESYIGNFNSQLDTIQLTIEQSLTDIENKIQSLADTLSSKNVKAEITKLSNEKITEIGITVVAQIESLNIHKKVKETTTKELGGYIVKIKETVNNKVNELPDSLDPEEIKIEVISSVNSVKGGISTQFEQIKKIVIVLQKELACVNKKITSLKIKVDSLFDNIRNKINDGIKPLADEVIKLYNTLQNTKISIREAFETMFYNKRTEFIRDLSKDILDLLIENFQVGNEIPAPIANIFNQIDNWMKDLITDLNTLLYKIKNEGGNIDAAIKKYFDPALNLYTDYKEAIAAIESGNKEAIIKQANKLSQTINQDFGDAVGKVTTGFYKAEKFSKNLRGLDREFQNTLFNYRSVVEDIKAVDLGINRQTVELIYNFKEISAPKVLITPIMGKLEKLNDSLSAVGITIPYGAIDEKFIAPMRQWGANFINSYSDKFPMSNLLKDIGGFKFDNLLPFLKGDDRFYKAVKVESKVDEKAMKAWVKADLDYTFTDDNTLMSIGPLKVRMLRNARIVAHAYEAYDIDQQRTSESYGAMKSTFEISLSGTPLMLFKETTVSFKNGKYDFDLDPSRMEMPGLLKLLTDASKNIPASDPASSKEGDSPFKMKILKFTVPNTKLEMPIGVQANLDIPPLSVGGGTTAISNLSFGGHFLLKAIDDSDPGKPKLDFNIGLGFYLGKRDLPFNFTAFILGGGGYIDCSFKYQPSVSKKPMVNFVMSVHGSAGLTISAGWITGSIMVLAGIEVEYSSSIGNTRIEIFVAIIGVVDILGLISVYLSLRLAINYQSNGNGTVLYGVGNVRVKIRICRFVTISVNKNYTMVLKGESKNVKNENSENIAASLN
ncbi:hypothetical protein [Sphingobacterium multivorum]|uniref:hypothetical protein n=1 Tax=Sphingobacterium multivorum TaxID=28454 RepID=UPI0031BB4292